MPGPARRPSPPASMFFRFPGGAPSTACERAGAAPSTHQSDSGRGRDGLCPIWWPQHAAQLRRRSARLAGARRPLPDEHAGVQPVMLPSPGRSPGAHDAGTPAPSKAVRRRRARRVPHRASRPSRKPSWIGGTAGSSGYFVRCPEADRAGHFVGRTSTGRAPAFAARPTSPPSTPSAWRRRPPNTPFIAATQCGHRRRVEVADDAPNRRATTPAPSGAPPPLSAPAALRCPAFRSARRESQRGAARRPASVAPRHRPRRQRRASA
jgi:hypothetical protein